MDERYAYTKLEKGHTRILHLQPDLSEGFLCGSLQAIDLKNAQDTFVALSWTWGKPAKQEDFQIKLDGKLLSIRSNLWHMLDAFRDRVGRLSLWVDAICIDQDPSKPQDKNNQIPMMADIYQAAREVWIWLGASGDDSDYVMESLSRQNEELYTSPRFVKGFLAILQRPWWTRTWILQEYILNAKSPTVFCGQAPDVSADIMLNVWIRKVPRRMVAQVCRDMSRLEKLGTIYWLHRLRESRDDPRGLYKRDLRNALAWLKGFEVTEPRDKIYGALGLINAEARERFVELFGVHAEKSAARVYWDASAYLLGHSKSSTIYCDFPVGQHNGHNVPSWVPNFNLDITSAFGSTVRLAGAATNRPENLSEEIVLSKDYCKLSTRGRVLDRVTESIVVSNATMPGLESHDEMEIYLRWPHLLHRIQNLVLKSKGVTSLDLPEPLWTTLIASCYGAPPGEKVEDAAEYQQRFDEIMAVPLCDPVLLAQIVSFEEWVLQRESFSAEDVEFCNYVASLGSILTQKPHILAQIRRTLSTGRNVFVGGNGYYGVSEPGTRKGDLVALLFPGQCIPFILRKRGESYEMVGVAYLPRPLLDAAIADVKQGRTRLENFDIV